MNLTIRINETKISLPKNMLDGIPFFDAKLKRWSSPTDTEIVITTLNECDMESRNQSHDSTEGNLETSSSDEQKSTKHIIQTILSMINPIEIKTYQDCCDYIKHASFFEAESLTKKCLTYLKSIMKRSNVLDIYLDCHQHIHDQTFLNNIKYHIGLNIVANYKRLMECDLDLLTMLADQKLSYFETQFDRYTFVTTLSKELGVKIDSDLIDLPIPQIILRVSPKVCVKIWLLSINFYQLTPVQKVIDDKIIPDTWIQQQHLSKIDQAWKMVEKKQTVSFPVYMNARIRLEKTSDTITIADPTGITGIKRFPSVKFCGINWSIEIRKGSTNKLGIFIFRNDEPEHTHWYENSIVVDFTLRIGSYFEQKSAPGSYLQNGHGWGWLNGFSYEKLFKHGDYIDMNTREIRISVMVESFNGKVQK